MTSKDGLYKQVFKNGASSETLRILLSELKKDGNPGKVIQECVRAIQIYPEDLFLRRLLAESYLEAGFISQAEMELERLTSQIDELVSPYKLLANIYRKQHRAEDAIRNLRIYLSHRPEDHEALGVFESLHAQPPMVVEEMPVPEVGEEAAAPEIHESVVGEQGEVSDEAPVSEIATPTLAEVYASQGDVVEALNIYHKVVDRNRQDERSGQRIKELEALLTRETAVPEKEVDGKRKKKERAIAILEAWLADLRRMYQDSATA